MHRLTMKHSDFISSNAIENAVRSDECDIYEEQPILQVVYLYVCVFILAGLFIGFFKLKGGGFDLAWLEIELIVVSFFILVDVLLFPVVMARFQIEVRLVAWRLLSDKEAMAKMKHSEK